MVDLGARVVTIDNCQKKDVALISDLANKWLRELQSNASERNNHAEPPQKEDSLSKLERLAALLASGALTMDEFQNAKRKILEQL